MANGFTASRISALVDRVRVASRQQLVSITREKVAENQAAIASLSGRPVPIRQFVDGSEGKPLEQAQRFTLTQFELIGHVVDAALQMLIERSPVGPDAGGHYRDDHWLFVNGERRDAAVEVHASRGGVIEIGPSDEVVIVNARPYARKIEGGRRPRRGNAGQAAARRAGLSVQAPDGVYEISARDLQRQFGNLARIRFEYRAVSGKSGRFPALVITSIAA